MAFLYVGDSSFNGQDIAAFRNASLVKWMLSVFFAALGHSKYKKLEYLDILQSDYAKIIFSYLSKNGDRPIITNLGKKDKIKAFIYKLFMRKHFLTAFTACKLMTIIKSN